MTARSKLNKLALRANDLELEVLGHRNAKNELYNILFPNEPPDEREVRWKWIVHQVRRLVQRNDTNAVDVTHTESEAQIKHAPACVSHEYTGVVRHEPTYLMSQQVQSNLSEST